MNKNRKEQKQKCNYFCIKTKKEMIIKFFEEVQNIQDKVKFKKKVSAIQKTDQGKQSPQKIQVQSKIKKSNQIKNQNDLAKSKINKEKQNHQIFQKIFEKYHKMPNFLCNCRELFQFFQLHIQMFFSQTGYLSKFVEHLEDLAQIQLKLKSVFYSETQNFPNIFNVKNRSEKSKNDQENSSNQFQKISKINQTQSLNLKEQLKSSLKTQDKIQPQQKPKKIKKIQIKKLESEVNECLEKLNSKISSIYQKKSFIDQSALTNQLEKPLINSYLYSRSFSNLESLIQNFKEKSLKLNLNFEFSQTQQSNEMFSILQESDFQDYCFFLFPNKKILISISYIYQKDMILLLNKEKQILCKIKLKKLISIILSENNNQLCEIFFNKKQHKKQIILEIPNLFRFLDILLQSKHFDYQCLKQKEELEIEQVEGFSQCSLNFFKQQKLGGIVKIWLNSLFNDWSINYFSLFEDFLLLIKLPDLIEYKSKGSFFQQMSLCDLRNVHWLDSRDQNLNTFALKFLNYQQDLFIVTPSVYHLDLWLQQFSNKISQNSVDYTKFTNAEKNKQKINQF